MNRLWRHYYTWTFPAWAGRDYVVKETRSKPWIVVFIENWFMWGHEFIYPFNKNLHNKYMKNLCYAYDQFIQPWCNKFERIEKEERL